MVAEMHEQTDTADLQVGTGQPITKGFVANFAS